MRLEVRVRAKDYRGVSGGARAVLRDVEFGLQAGHVGAILGPSGCGKTTLLRIIAGLDADFEGEIRRPAAGRLAMVFQEPRLLPWRTVEENVRLAAPAATEADIAALFAPLGLGEHRRHYPLELSLGLARRVALARALAAKPDLLLLDEPLASLDSATAARLMHEIAGLVESRAVTTLIVTHDVEAAIRLADLIFVFSHPPARLVATMEVEAPRGRMDARAAARLSERIEAASAGEGP